LRINYPFPIRQPRLTARILRGSARATSGTFSGLTDEPSRRDHEPLMQPVKEGYELLASQVSRRRRHRDDDEENHPSSTPTTRHARRD
jgi:hypothetical protein